MDCYLYICNTFLVNSDFNTQIDELYAQDGLELVDDSQIVQPKNNKQSCAETQSSKEKSAKQASVSTQLLGKTIKPTCSTQAAHDTTLSIVPIKSKLRSQLSNNKKQEHLDENRPLEYSVDEMFKFAQNGKFPERIYVIGTVLNFIK
jgi:hypothetical protein